MKGAIAAFVAAVAGLDPAVQTGSLSFLITGDEEGVAHDGTGKVVAALMAEGEIVDHCVLGEPTSAARFGDQIKVGRRGSLNARITVEGRQGHVAYPHKAANPIPVLVKLLAKLNDRVLDEGYPRFPASNLEITTIDVGNPATNVIPGKAVARLNIRFNPCHTGAVLVAWLEAEAAHAGQGFNGKVTVETRINGEAFLTPPGAFTDVVSAAVEAVTGEAPELSTTGGTSDARFIRALCPVVEFGLVGTTMHQIDERVPIAEIHALTVIYRRLIEGYFARFG
jgi:succinyl-diaminopimelate desuccinylase